MRIITGSLKGRKLKSPKGDAVRPTTDKVKEAIFDMLYAYMEDGCVCMDVFAGSGNMGLEAISRGAKTVYFSDASRESLALVKENVKYCQVEDNAVLLAGDYKYNIKRVHDTVDIYFLDPPYANGFILPAIKAIDDSGNMAEGGLIVCETAAKEELPEEYLGFKLIKQRRYGTTLVSIYQKSTEN